MVTEAAAPSTPLDAAVAPLRCRGLTVTYGRRARQTRALRDVDVTVRAGQAVGIIGESGAGKSTLARALLGLVQPASGSVEILGHDVGAASHAEAARLRSRVQVVMQNPYSSLNPRWPVRRIIAEPLHAGRRVGIVEMTRMELDARVEELVAAVGLDRQVIRKRPGELSGGERQRVAIARALATAPDVLIGDEPVTALDNATSRIVVALLREIQRTQDLSLLVISHSIDFIEALTSYAYVMHRGRVVEHGLTAEVLSAPQHPYTQRLVAASQALG